MILAKNLVDSITTHRALNLVILTWVTLACYTTSERMTNNNIIVIIIICVLLNILSVRMMVLFRCYCVCNKRQGKWVIIFLYLNTDIFGVRKELEGKID
jgi:hypothetical protein